MLEDFLCKILEDAFPIETYTTTIYSNTYTKYMLMVI